MKDLQLYAAAGSTGVSAAEVRTSKYVTWLVTYQHKLQLASRKD